MRRLSLLVLLAAAFGLPGLRALTGVAAQEPYQMSIDQIIVSDHQDTITALVSVFDPAGQSVEDIKTFTALIDNTEVAVQSLSSIVGERPGISVLLLMDVSGSMQGDPLEQARSAAKTLVQGLLPQDSAALVPFAGSVASGRQFTSDRASLLTEIDGLATEPGGTALYQAVVEGPLLSAQAPTAKRAIVLLTDGQESGASAVDREAALRAAGASGTPIFTIGLGPDADAELLQAIASASQGSFYYAPAPTDLSRIFDAVGGHLQSQYEIVLPIPKATLTSRDLVIETRVGQTVVRAEGHFATTAPAPTKTGDNGPPLWIWPAIAVLALPILALAARRWRPARRRPQSPLSGGPGGELTLPGRRPSAPVSTLSTGGRLTVVAGPTVGQSVSVSSSPVDIGSHPDCDLRLDDESGLIAARYARVWLQHDRLILHRLAPGGSSAAAAAPEWGSLEPNDTFRVGPYVLSFELKTPPSQSA